MQTFTTVVQLSALAIALYVGFSAFSIGMFA